MKSASILSVASLVGLSSAFPSYIEKRQDPHAYQPNPSGAVRSPCPGLNTLANHGYINRNGNGISKQAAQQGFLDAFGFDFSSTDAGTTNAINLCSQLTNTQCQTFDLWMMDKAHAIEHDASLTRNDKNGPDGNSWDFAQDIWAQTLQFWGNPSHINTGLANMARLGRVNQARAADAPGWFVQNDGGSLTEHAFALTCMNDPSVSPGQSTNPQARLDWINHWFQQEELPTALGWSKPTQTIAIDYLNQVVSAVQNAPSTAPSPGIFYPDSNAVAANDKRDLASMLADPQQNATAQAAIVSALSAAGPKPTQPNAYTQVLAPHEWLSEQENIQSYFDKVTDTLKSILGNGIFGDSS